MTKGKGKRTENNLTAKAKAEGRKELAKEILSEFGKEIRYYIPNTNWRIFKRKLQKEAENNGMA